jgi:four helix bundle protein
MERVESDSRGVGSVIRESAPSRYWAMQDSRNLRVAEYAEDLAVATYEHTATFPRSECFGLTSQMRRAAVSIASNIAEGCGRRNNRELLPFLSNAAGSVSELACQLRIATRLHFGEQACAEQLRIEALRVAKMLARLTSYHRAQSTTRQRGESRE